MTGYSLDAYRGLLELARERGYPFLRFAGEEEPDGPGLYLRHDVDYSLEMALELARVNHALGVRGTFFVLLRGETYNLLTYRSLQRVRELVGLGQDVGFHYAAPRPLPTRQALADAVSRDFATTGAHLPELLPVFAWHNTTPELIELGLDLDVPGLSSANSRRLGRDIPYVSDSNMRHTVEELRAAISAGHPRLQLLLHPINWVAGGDSMPDVLANAWRWILRESEREMRGNRVYAERLPEGLPSALVGGFCASLREALG